MILCEGVTIELPTVDGGSTPLLAQGQTKAAKEHLKKAASSKEDVVVKREAEERLRALP